nr:uncharacterized protein LOC112790197 isoform X4 [Arachis hypogaea]
MLVGDDFLMFNAKRIERVVLEYACNALFLKSKVQKQPIRQNPEVTLCCDVRCKIVGRSEEPNVYISNEQTTAAATLSFIQTSISWKHNFCLPVLVPSRDPKSCESRNPMCSKPTPAFKKSQRVERQIWSCCLFFFCFFNCAAVFGFRDKILLGVMDDDLLLMVRSGFAVAAVPVLVPNSNSRSLTLLHNKCIQIEERGKQGERGKRRETALAGASPLSLSLSSVKGGEERACIQERRDAVCRHRRRPGACRRAASRRRPVHGPTSLRYCRSVHKPSSMGQNREERETHEEKPTTSLVAVSAAGCSHHPRELPSHRRYSTAVVALCCWCVSPSRRWRRKAHQFCFCLWVLESEKMPMPLLFVGFRIIAATGITNRKGEVAVFRCHWCCHRTVEAIADYDFDIWVLV